MKSTILFAWLLISTLAHSQIKFEKGYFIDNKDQRVECLIRNMAWQNNPYKFEYKLTEAGEEKTGVLADVKEFGFGDNAQKFVRAKVKIDLSSDNTAKLSRQRAPEWDESEVYLISLVEGSASLYYWYGDEKGRFFFSVNGSPIEQLVFKYYLVSTKGKGIAFKEEEVRAPNLEYINQLQTQVNCRNQTVEAIAKVRYRINDLKKYFLDYLACKGESAVARGSVTDEVTFHLTFKPGVNFSSYATTTSTFDPQAGIRLGAEFEMVPPFSKNRWTLLGEPTYRSYVADGSETTNNSLTGAPTTITKKINYTSLEAHIGVRYYAFLNADSRIFFNIHYVVDLPFSSTITVGTTVSEIDSSPCWALGAGIAHKKFSLEGRYFSNRALERVAAGSSIYKNVSIIVGYKLF